MEIHKNDIGSLIKNQLSNLKESPDDSVWNTIEAQLKKEKKRRRFLAFWIFGIFLSAILLATLIFDTFGDNNYRKNNLPSPIKDKNKNIIAPLDTKNPIEGNTTAESGSYNNNQDSYSSPQRQQTKKQQRKTAGLSKHMESQAYSPNDKLHFGSKNKKKDQLNEDKRNLNELVDTNRSIDTNRIPEKLQSAESTSSRDTTLKRPESSENKSRKEERKDSSDAQEPNKWSVIPQGSLSYFGNFSANSSDNITANYGLLFSYTRNEQLFLRFGIRQLKLNQKTNNESLEFKYLEFPLDIKYVPFDKKLNPYITGGLSTILLQESKNSSTIDLNHNSPSFSVNLGLGVEYELFKDVYINLEPYFNYQIKPITNSDDISPFILSIHTGIEFRF